MPVRSLWFGEAYALLDRFRGLAQFEPTFAIDASSKGASVQRAFTDIEKGLALSILVTGGAE
jgi:hypothetical protein